METCSKIQSAATIREAEIISKESGINGNSCFSSIRHFDVTKCFPHGIMHVLFEGIYPREIRLLLIHCITEMKYFSLEDLNSRILSFDYGYISQKSQPTPLHPDVLKTEKRINQQGVLCL